MGMPCSAASVSNSDVSTSPRSIMRSDCSRLVWLMSSRSIMLISSAQRTAHFFTSSLSPVRQMNTGCSSLVPMSVNPPYTSGMVGFVRMASGRFSTRGSPSGRMTLPVLSSSSALRSIIFRIRAILTVTR